MRHRNMIALSLVVVFSAPSWIYCQNFGPPYPVTGSWFKDRYTRTEWNETLREFTKLGGDTVILRAPALVSVNPDSFSQDPNFRWCSRCMQTAASDLSVYNITIQSVWTYTYEEDFTDDAMIQCRLFDKKISSDRIYYRLVLPTNPAPQSGPCPLNNSDVVVIFTTFAGTDPHALLIEEAEQHNVSVYFGVPLPPYEYNGSDLTSFADYLIPPYLEFLGRVFADHDNRFNDKALKGYFWSKDILLQDSKYTASRDKTSSEFDLFRQVRALLKERNYRFGLSTFTQANKFEKYSTVEDYTKTFKLLVTGNYTDVISVKDGRGSGYGALYWSTQTKANIESVDADLYKILTENYPAIFFNKTIKTFGDVFLFSTNELMSSLSTTRDQLVADGYNIDVWLNIEAYDNLHDDPCLPVDTAGSGLNRMLNRVTKSRIDRVLTHAGTTTQKIVSDAWDPCFTCSTANKTTPLNNQIMADKSRPIIAHCSLHSSFNRSVVVIGYNLYGETQGFTTDWPKYDGTRQVSSVYGYYFELDWGAQHQRVPSLAYIQMYDPYDVRDLAEKGYIKVTANSGYHTCIFEYDYSNRENGFVQTLEKRKKFYKVQEKPLHRVYGQDKPFY